MIALNQSKKHYTQDEIPVPDIKNGLIVTTDNRYLKIIEIEPINFSLRNASEQDNIIAYFASFLKVAPVKMQIKTISRSADTSAYIDRVDQKLAKESNPKCCELGAEYKALVQHIGSQTAIARRYFIIFEYEPISESHRATDPMEIKIEMDRTVTKAINYFANCGNEVKYATRDGNEDYFLAEILYNYFNRRSSETEPFSDRVNRVIDDSQAIHNIPVNSNIVPLIPIVNYIAPRGIDFQNRSYVMMDGLYYSYLYFTSNGYPTSVYAGWLSSIVTMGEGIDVDIFLTQQDRIPFIDKVSRKIRLTGIKLKERNDSQRDFEEIAGAIQSARYIKRAMTQENQDAYYMNIIITVIGRTQDEMEYKKQDVMDRIRSADMQVRDCLFEQERAFNSVAPFLQLDKKLYNLSKRNVLTDGVAASYCFTAFELSDDDGFMFGVNKSNRSLTIVDLFNTKKLKNANVFLAGTSGSGKTFTLLLLGLRLRMLGTQVFVLTPDKAREYRRSCAAIGGEFIQISAASNSCINIMEIRPSVSPTAELLDGYEENETSWLVEKAQNVTTFINLIVGDLTVEEEAQIDRAIIATYAKFDITRDNNSIYLDKLKGILRPMPIIEDFFNVLCTIENVSPRLITIIGSRFIHGAFQSFNQQTNVDLDNKYIVFSLEGLKDTPILPAAMFLVLDFIWAKVKEDITQQKLVEIDEGWQLIGAGANQNAAKFVQRLFKVIRGYAGAALLATQDIGDLFALDDGKFGEAILSCSQTKIIMNLEEKEAKKVKQYLNLSSREVTDITRYERGEALVCIGGNHVPINILASQAETDLITTDPADNRRLTEERLKRKQAQEAMEKTQQQRA